jgi:hypothetical protein
VERRPRGGLQHGCWFSQQITVGNSPWGEFFDREQQRGTWATVRRPQFNLRLLPTRSWQRSKEILACSSTSNENAIEV